MQRIMRITKILTVPAVGAGYYEDLAALQAHPLSMPERFRATPVTPGFRAVREVAEAVAVGLVLDSGQVAWGDCVAVSYSGKAGRDPVFRAGEGLATIQRSVAPALEGRELASFRELAAEVDALTEPVQVSRPLSPVPDRHRTGRSEPEVEDPSRRALLTAPFRALAVDRQPSTQSPHEASNTQWERATEEHPLHTAIRYGVSQALLQAVALAQGVTMAEVIAQEWGLPLPDAPVPIHAQSGSERYDNADKMIVRGIASLPHALVDNIPEQVGQDGAKMTRYIRWLKERIGQLGGAEAGQSTGTMYRPTIHLDLHGALGQIYGNQMGRMLGQLYAWEAAAQPYPLRIECPVILDSREAQIEAMKTLREYIRLRGMKVHLVADEWANTLEDIRAFVEAGAADMIQVKMPDLGSLHHAVEAVLACKAGGVGAFLGGSYAETEVSARASVHVALATQADLLMAKPGMGVDEAISLVQNEMMRTLAQIRDA